jgi:hypothetical protein
LASKFKRRFRKHDFAPRVKVRTQGVKLGPRVES